MPLCDNVPPPHLNYHALISVDRLAVYLKVLMLEWLHFFQSTGSLVLLWVYDATVGCS